jgi:hypothetical protein
LWLKIHRRRPAPVKLRLNPNDLLARLLQAFPPGRGVALGRPDTDALLDAFRRTFDATLVDLLDGRPVARVTHPLSEREADLAIAYGVRNKAAHGLERPSAITTEFDRVYPRLFYAVFLALEVLYL